MASWAARSGLAPRYVALGHAMAHEMGHLLLGTNQHYLQGIMSPDWSPEDLRLAAWGMLLFTAEQAKRLRADVLARERAQAGMQTAGISSRGVPGTRTR